MDQNRKSKGPPRGQEETMLNSQKNPKVRTWGQGGQPRESGIRAQK